MNPDPIEIDTADGKVYLAAFPKEHHRDTVFAVLGKAVGRSVSAADLQESEERPRPEFPSLGLDANWTHSGDVCVLAYSFECRVGVDLERFRNRGLGIAKRFFHADEVAYLERLLDENSVPGGETVSDVGADSPAMAAFYDLWCRKEAYFKCAGGDFFAEALRTSMLADCVNGVHLKKMNPEMLGIHDRFGFCLATRPNRR